VTSPCIVEHCTRDLRDYELAARQMLCDPCVHQMRRWLGAIPNLVIVLRDGSLQRERTGDAVRGGTKEVPLPGRPVTMNLIGPASTGDIRDPFGDQEGSRPIIGTLDDWVRILCHERRLNGPTRYREEDLAAWLIPQLGWISQQPWAGEMHAELWNMICTALRIASIEHRTRAISRPCPNPDCQMMTLARRDWDLYTRCSNCGNAYTDGELNADAVARAAA
jgi:hypothetical protein